jgi:hypothetical protein
LTALSGTFASHLLVAFFPLKQLPLQRACSDNIQALFFRFLQPEIRSSNALIMTVPQAKGLEFDDVFLVDFFANSPGVHRRFRQLEVSVANLGARNVCEARKHVTL